MRFNSFFMLSPFYTFLNLAHFWMEMSGKIWFCDKEIKFYFCQTSKDNHTKFMGEQKVSLVKDQRQMQKFVKSLIVRRRSFVWIHAGKWLSENDITRIRGRTGNGHGQSQQLQASLCCHWNARKTQDYEWVGTELAKFNLETNLTPVNFLLLFSRPAHRKQRQTQHHPGCCWKKMGVSLMQNRYPAYFA